MITDDPLKIQRRPPPPVVFVIASHAALIVSQLCLYLICIYFRYSVSFQTRFFLSLNYPSENTASLFSRSPAAVLHLSQSPPRIAA